MEILEKKIGVRYVRIVFFDKHKYSKDYFIQKIIKKNIYFDYIVVTGSFTYRGENRKIYTNDLTLLDDEKYINIYFNYEAIIKNYEASKEYKISKRKNKLERILYE